MPDGAPESEALSRLTHLGIAAHQDDLEIMAYHGIVECFGRTDRWFGGVVMSNGAGSPRAGHYAEFSDEEMLRVRHREQRKAAVVGEYVVALLGYPPEESRDLDNPAPAEDLRRLLGATRAQTIYTHNLADKHRAHVAVALRVIEALRSMADHQRPQRLLGCEVWRDLDWLDDEEKVVLDVQGHGNLAAALLGLYDSQIDGGKRYDLAALGRRRAHATYYAPLVTDDTAELSLAMDLTPLLRDPMRDPAEFVCEHIERFRQDVVARIDDLRPQRRP
ncbi:MAG: PIG-L deacetylase family protein [Armatimonadota bacterium]